jgi:hypothetical protein
MKLGIQVSVFMVQVINFLNDCKSTDCIVENDLGSIFFFVLEV